MLQVFSLFFSSFESPFWASNCGVNVDAIKGNSTDVCVPLQFIIFVRDGKFDYSLWEPKKEKQLTTACSSHVVRPTAKSPLIKNTLYNTTFMYAS
jgi:hypothetical protein